MVILRYILCVFQINLYYLHCGAVKKAECQRIDAFELRCWRRLLRVSWITRRSNQSILKEISSRCSLEGMMLKLTLQYFGHLMRRVHWKRLWCWEGLGAGEGDDRGWDGWMSSPTRWTWAWVNSRSWWWTGRPGLLRFMGLQRFGHDWVTELNWAELKAHLTLHSRMSGSTWVFLPQWLSGSLTFFVKFCKFSPVLLYICCLC